MQFGASHEKFARNSTRQESVIGNLQSVYTTALNLKNSLAILKFHLVEKGSINVVRVVEELERLAELAYVSVSDRLDQLSSTANAFNLGQSRTPADAMEQIRYIHPKLGEMFTPNF